MLKAFVRCGAYGPATMRPLSRKRVKAVPRLSVFPLTRPIRWLSGPIVLFWGIWRRRSRERVELLALTDQELRDIGPARCDTLSESNKWFRHG